MMASRLILIALVAFLSTCATAQNSDDVNSQLDKTDLTTTAGGMKLFKAWQAKHGITYSSPQEESEGFQNFMQRAINIQKHRSGFKTGKHTHNQALNKFSAMSFDKFTSTKLGLKQNANRVKNVSPVPDSTGRTKRATLPPSLNYTAQGYVTPVKDQGECGCCWSFGTTGVLEGAYFKKNAKLQSFSEEMLVECVPDLIGCDGGDSADAVIWVGQVGGLPAEASYPYVAGNGNYGNCVQGTIANVKMLPTYNDIATDDTQLLNALVTYGPISVSVAVGDPFMSYMSGVMDPTVACSAPINHAVLLVGYGTDAASKLPYWLIKNSWSTDWGENGYFRLRRDITDSCGINENAIYVTM